MENELLLRAICAYENEGIADFTYKDLKQFGTTNTIKRNLSKLEQEGLIEKINLNGTCSRYKIFKVMGCYKFIYNEEFNITYKNILLQISKLENLPDIITRSFLEHNIKSSHNTIAKYFKDTILTDLDLNIIKLNITGNFINSEYGMLPMGAKKYEYKCQYCGATQESSFAKGSHITCRRCSELKRRKTKEIHEWLWNKSFKRFKSSEHITDYDITPEYIKELLEKQNYKCHYSKREFDICSKYYQPTIDRIDSSKGYIQGNIVICCNIINVMKSDQTLEEFKSNIDLLYNILNN